MFTRIRVASSLSLLLVLAAIFLVACGGKDVDSNADATAAAATPAATDLQITAKGNNFDKSTLVLKAGEQISLTMDNEDGGTLHNVAIYTNKSAADLIYRGEYTTGVKLIDYTFTAPEPGIYYFRCDAHPDSMVGTVVVK